jgi:hypothetical protein
LEKKNKELDPGGHHLTHDWMRMAVDTHLLGLSGQPLILCEGADDPLFVVTLAKFFGLTVEGVQLRETSGGGSSADFQALIRKITKDLGSARVRFLRDPDFWVEAAAGLNKETNEFLWGLPSVESYLFLYHCEQHRKQSLPGSPLAFLLDEKTQTFIASSFLNSFRYQNRSDDLLGCMFPLWSRALTAAAVPTPGTEEFITVGKVLRGHTWVSKVQKTKTPALIGLVQKDIVELCPELGQLLGQLLMVRRLFSAS